MYTKKRKLNWQLYCLILMLLELIFLGYLIMSDPIKVVSYDNKGNGKTTAGVIEQVNSYISQSSLGDAQISGVVVTECQQDFEGPEGDFPLEFIGEKGIIYQAFDLTEQEKYLLAKLVQCEAGNQSLEAKEAVVMVVINRVDDERFPDTIEDVIKENHDGVYQFSPLMEDGSWYYTEPTDEAYKAIDNVQYLETDMYLWCDYLYFESLPPNEENWHSKNLEFTQQIGDIKFYR